MKKKLQLWVGALGLAASVQVTLGCVNDVVAYQPCWRGQTGVTIQKWAFTTASGGYNSYADANVAASPFTNPNGTPRVSVVAANSGVGWITGDVTDPNASFSTNCAGWWDLGFDGLGSMTVNIPAANTGASSV